MKTTQFKTKIDRKQHQIDAANQAVGRIATQAAYLLRGKNKVDYVPQTDIGDFVEITNIDKLKLTDKKLKQKKYYHYSGYPGGLKTKLLQEVYSNNPEEVLKRAVWNMLPKNKLRQHMIKRLTFK